MSHAPTAGRDCASGCPLAGRPVALANAGDAAAGPAGVDRRVFLSRAVLAAAAAALAACGAAGGADVTAPSSVGSTVHLASYPDLATVGGVQTVTLNGNAFAIVRTGASSFITLSLACPHKGTTLDVVSGGFHCPNHGATFDSTGQWVGGQSAGHMYTYPTTYDATAGTLTIG